MPVRWITGAAATNSAPSARAPPASNQNHPELRGRRIVMANSWLPFQADAAAQERGHVEVLAVVECWFASVEASARDAFEGQRLLFRLRRLLLRGGFGFGNRPRRRGLTSRQG